jgi:hypothetical protein
MDLIDQGIIKIVPLVLEDYDSDGNVIRNLQTIAIIEPKTYETEEQTRDRTQSPSYTWSTGK